MLVTSRRSSGNDLILAIIFPFIAGAANACGLFALGQDTSHMTGYLSSLADNVAIAELRIAMVSALAFGAFVTGAGFSAILINWARNHAVG